MGFLKSIFGGSSGDSNQPAVNKEIRSVPDLFQLDILKIPYDEFIGGNVETNSAGDEIKLYRKILNYKECGIFDTVEVVYLSPTTHNVNFSNSNWSREIGPLQKLIDNLYLLLGDDYSGNGRFNNDDRSRVLNKDFWGGRMWDKPWSILISVDDLDGNNKLTLSIHCDTKI